MAEILKIEGAKVKIGEDDGRVVTVPIASLQFANPKVGDKVEVFRDGDDYLVKKVGREKHQAKDNTKTAPVEGERMINKHVFVWIGNFMFGGCGADRFMRGQVGLGILKLVLNTIGWLTIVGGFAGGIWTFVDLITALMKAYGSDYGSDENITFDAEGNYLK